eukprot:CAMPEP_0174913344 /NCGR_PEP_ID=MMETSP0167-20121228/80270_1 /TAXON_ID=38298 /ORGANISM="Rhodella maculata, Strain CCMP736" /LENGTH=41 /DNA_ID= /DNA_START= /DNA_END= /DNA_ORIENTATION=
MALYATSREPAALDRQLLSLPPPTPPTTADGRASSPASLCY